MELFASASIFLIATLLMTVFYHVRYLNQYSTSNPLDYRAIRSGNWSDLNVWEVSDDGKWVKASLIPNATNVTVFIPSDVIIEMNHDVVANNIFIQEGGSLNMTTGKLKIVKAFDQGTLACNGTLRMAGAEVFGDGDVVVAPGSSLYCVMEHGNSVANFRVTGKQSIGSGVKFFTF
ncbi:MAG: hypothetical protein RL491_938 [Bacteroidota bacterium]